jgi:hypothetical protein
MSASLAAWADHVTSDASMEAKAATVVEVVACIVVMITSIEGTSAGAASGAD